MTRVAQLLAQASTGLSDSGVDSPRLEAEILLSHILKRSRTWMMTWPEKKVEAASVADFLQLIESRCQGSPVAYLTGEREFWSLTLKVTTDTLIPRPETELLVENVLAIGATRQSLSVLDLGTGSGAIAIALAVEKPSWKITATDVSHAALDVAQTNATTHQADNIHFLHGSWFDPIAAGKRFDIIVSNPPYVAANDPHLQQGDLRYEPATALASGDQGLDDLKMVIGGAREHLYPGGWLLVEHGLDQGAAVRQLFADHGLETISTELDLQQHQRITLGQQIK